ncbi:glycosyltransferase family 1 protein [Neorhizobium lilium]|uniref:Glycosyltransferase family 1 protein n=1 Tax=Neorhizobium lilium TaxID=2503024 RepID=A0A444LIV1_9HYPH|nr:glycosyltransferase [Neorhizobium lilium]RWX78966.1 glycosyltransferase family 1 protein [Neorhizobium lilium]
MRPVPNISSIRSSTPTQILVCLSHLRWNFVYQRPQHLLSRAAKNHLVFFLEEPLFEDISEPRLDLNHTPEGVRVGVPILPHGLSHREIVEAQKDMLDDLLAALPPLTLAFWYYTPMALEFSRHIEPDVLVYDNMDELSAFRGAPAPLLALERELFERADVVFTGGESLYEAKRGRHHNVQCFPSSIDVSHFGKTRALSRKISKTHVPDAPRLGFFGVIDERMDPDLVAAIADLRPAWQIDMVGPVVKIDPALLPQRDNLHWLGSRSYQELPQEMARWDIGIMPFAINEATRFISPTKTPEFLAAGLPVVCTPIRDVIRPYGQLGLVEIAATAEEMVAKIEILLARPRELWLAEVDAHLAKNSWDRTWDGMNAAMGEASNSLATGFAFAAKERANV